MPEDGEKNQRIHRVKGHKDPYSELMEDSPATHEEEESEEEEKESDIEEEREDEEHEDEEEKPRKGIDETDESNEYADLLVEDGTHEEGIHGEMEDEEPVSIHAPTPNPSREKIKEQLVLKARGHGTEDPSNVMKLELLELSTKKALFIGRKKSVLQKSGLNGGLYLGKVQDDERFIDHKLYLDSLNPHVVFVCGARGSGKSYVLGVMAEELALQNPNVGAVVVDPVGVFWSMKYPNKEEKEVKDLPHFGLLPQGLENMKVFIPEGMKTETPKSTYDALFSIPPALLTSEDWCLTFGIERFSPTGLLMEKALKKVEKGYRSMGGETRKGKKSAYSLNDLVVCLETDAELHSKERGYKPDSVRALVSRFEAAKNWGIFSERGTPLAEISKAGQLTVIDTSFLDDTVTALVIGILARRLLAARKLQTRKEAAEEVREKSVESLLENEIPPTWLFIDEAHTLIPSGNVSTPATTAIVEYVKQGRRPGCSLVFATQQPSAIDTRVLSQLDVIMSHKLIFDDDIKAVTKRTPTIIPLKYKHPHFLKTLPVGTALVGDRREETNRAFVLKVRPRMSQHEGRDAETGERKKELSAADVQRLTIELLLSTLQKEGRMDKETVEQVLKALNQKYKARVMLSDVLTELEARGARINPKDASVHWPGAEEEEDTPIHSEKDAQAKVEALTKLVEPNRMEEEETRLQAFPITQSKEKIVEAFQKAARKNLFGLGKPAESLQEIQLRYMPVWKVQYRQFTGKTSYVTRECFIDAEKGEFLHYLNNGFVASTGLRAVEGMSPSDFSILRSLAQKPNQTIPELVRRNAMDEKSVKRSLVKMVDRHLINVKNEEKTPIFGIDKSLDLPLSGNEKELSSMQNVKLVDVPSISAEKTRVTEEEIHSVLSQMWPNVNVTTVSPIFRPIFEATLLNSKTNEYRSVKLDAFTGKIIEE